MDDFEQWLVTPVEPDAHVMSLCCHDDYCVETPTNRCPCCGGMFCDAHTVMGWGLCIHCDDWIERNEEMA